MMIPYSDREIHEECGVFGIYGVDNAASLTCLLYTSDAADDR